MTSPFRYHFAIKLRIADTTLLDALATVDPAALRQVLHSATRSAMRSKSIAVDWPAIRRRLDGRQVRDGSLCLRKIRPAAFTFRYRRSHRPHRHDDRHPVQLRGASLHRGRTGSAGYRLTHETRYFLSGLPANRFVTPQSLSVIRRHWAVETTHQILDVTFQEDERPWLTHNPRLTATIIILRRLGYTLLSVFKNVTQRSTRRRQEPLHRLLTRIRDALLQATPPPSTVCVDARQNPHPPSHRSCANLG